MPVIAIAGAALAWAGAAGAIGTIAAGGLAALSVTEVLALTVAVGATLGAVGAVTRDKGLMTAGMIIGGIGGIGSLAVSAGLFGAEAGSATLFGSGADAIPSSVDITPQIVGSNMGGESAGIVDSFGGVDASAVLPTETAPLEGTTPVGGNASDDITNSLMNTAAPAAPSVPTSIAPEISPMAENVPAAVTPAAPASPSAFAPDDFEITQGIAPVSPAVQTPGMLDALGNFIKNDKSGMVGYGMIQAGGSLISGLFDPLKPAQIKALEANSANTNAQTALSLTQQQNIAQPIPVATRAKAPTGLINSGVTG